MNEGIPEACNNFTDLDQCTMLMYGRYLAPSSFHFLKRSNDQSRQAWNIIYQKQSDSTFKGYLEKLNQEYEKNEKGDLALLMKN